MDEGGRVVIDQIFETRRKALAQAVHVAPDQGRGRDRVGARGKINADPDCRLTVEVAFDVLVLGAEFDSRDIAHAQQRTVRIGAQDDIAELLGVVRRPWVCTFIWNCWSLPIGRAPIRPTGASTFCAWIAAMTSAGVNCRLSRRWVSNQMRIE